MKKNRPEQNSRALAQRLPVFSKRLIAVLVLIAVAGTAALLTVNSLTSAQEMRTGRIQVDPQKGKSPLTHPSPKGDAAMAPAALTVVPFFQGFETDNSSWNVFGGTNDATRVASGTNGVTSKTGGFHAEAAMATIDSPPNDGSAATNWGGYSSVFPSGGYVTTVDIYLNMSGGAANDTRFDWDSAINNNTGGFRRDFVFNAGFYSDTDVTGSGPRFVVSASNNAGRGSSFPKNPGRDPFALTSSGWYTFKHRFYNNGGILFVDLSIINSSGTQVHSWTLSDAGDTIATTGGNRYGWFDVNEFSFLAFDNSRVSSGLVVDDDYVQCPYAGYTTIGAAVAAASNGDTIQVCSGTYAENVTINKSLTLLGAQSGVDARGRAATESIVTAGSGTLFTLVTGSASSVIDGFTFSAAARSIESTSGPLNNLQIRNNRLIGFTNSGIFLNDPGNDITVNQNSIDGSSKVGAGDLVHLDTDTFDGFYLTDNNISNGATASGFFVDGNHNVGESATRDPLISGNLINNNNTGMNLGTRAFGENGTPATGTYGGAISNNTFRNNTFDGLQGGFQHVLISGNTFKDNGRHGIALTSFGNLGADRGVQNSLLTCNSITGNGFTNTGSGILYSVQAAGTQSTNQTHQNDVVGNRVGATYTGGDTINAENNWWGSPSGPSGAYGGSGDAVSSLNIDAIPFLTGASNCPAACTTNVALSTYGATASASSTANPSFPASGVIDGEHDGNNWGSGGGWNDGTSTVFPDNVQVNLNVIQSIETIDVYTLKDDFNSGSTVGDATTFTGYGITSFDVQTWNGAAWVTVPGGSVTGNNKVKRRFNFASPISTDKIRVVVNAAADGEYSRVVEIEAFSCAPVVVPTPTPTATPTPTPSPSPTVTPTPSPTPCASTNVALGGTAVASSTVNGSFPASGVIDGEHNGNNWGAGGGWNDGTLSAFPDNVQVTFSSFQTFGEIDVYTLKDDFNSGSTVNDTTTFTGYGITNFNVQYWTGSVWTDVPGGAVTGNNLVKRKFIFPDITTNMIRVVVNASADNQYSRVVEIEALACAPTPNLCVNNGGTGGCYNTIQGAVNAASPGAIIDVAAGTYPELVTVNKSVILRGAQAGMDPRAYSCTGAPATESVVTGNSGTTSFYVTASDVTIDGFTVQGATNVNQFGAGIVLAGGTAGADVRNNKIHDNITGLFLANNSAGNQGVVYRNLFCNNTQPGATSGHGIYADQFTSGGPIRNVLIDSNNFVNNNGATGGTWGIGMSNTDTANPNTNLQVVNNTFNSTSPASRGMYLYATHSSAITGNTIIGKTNYAIGLFGGDDAISISCNSITNNSGRGIYVSDDLSTPNTNVTAHNNNIAGNVIAGLTVDAGTHTGTLNAESNWWGSATGPTIASNPGGTGDVIDDPGAVVDYSPFLTAGSTCAPSPCTDPANNVALATMGSTAAASSTVNPSFPASGVIDGEHNGNNWGSGGGWNDNTSGVFPDNVQVNFAAAQTIREIDVYTLKDDFNSGSTVTDTTTFSAYGNTSFDVQTWNGASWVTVPGGSVTGNNLVKRKFTFPDITTTMIRVVVNASADNGYSRVVEIEAFACNPAPVNCVNPGGTGGCSNTIQGAINAASPGGVVFVYPGSYGEDVNVNKAGLRLIGAGAGTTTIHGPIGGPGSTVAITDNNVTVAGFTITRDGNNTTDWNNGGLNSAGLSIQGTSITGATIRDNTFTGNRTGIDINNSSGHTVRNNVIDFNRTGLIFRNQTDFITVVENQITNNWTVGIVFLDGSGGTNTPVQSAAHSAFSNNNMSANWYGQIVERQSGGSLPAPNTTNLKNFRGNWLGTTSPVVTTANSAEPGYAAQIPVAYGGSATPPGGQPDVAGPASDNFRIQPILVSGTDTNVESTPGWGTNGFQGATISVISPANANARGWFFYDDNMAGVGSTGFENGEGTPPLGTGSAFFQIDSVAGHAFEVFATYHGTRMDDISSLLYSSYQNGNSNIAAAVALDFDIDYDLTDGNNAFQGRLVFEPYQTPSNNVQQLVWQNWDALAGKWWASGAPGNGPCPQATPCTWAQVLTAFPNAGIRNTTSSGILFKAGGGLGSNFDGNVDALKVGIRAFRTTYNYEPAP